MNTSLILVFAHCYWDRPLEGKDRRPRAYYFIKKEGCAYIGRVELKTGSGFDIVILPLKNGKVFVAIERLSCFHFANWKALMPPNQSAQYIAEKLACGVDDAFELSGIFSLIHNKIANS